VVAPRDVMQFFRSLSLGRVVALMAALLVVKVTLSIVLGYRDYFPPNFRSDFLSGRQSYFFGAYRWAFYAHLASGPVTLLAGLALVSERFRRSRPGLHRSLGKLQIGLVAFVLAPSGAWMSWYAQSGGVAGAGFFVLAILTAFCALMGWRSATRRRFAEHRQWMMRCFLLLCSAVVVRLVGGLATVTGVDAAWIYPLTAWVSWIAPLAVFETSELMRRRQERQSPRGVLWPSGA